MALPLVYNVESVRVRWRSTLVAVLGIAGSVGVFVAMLALARGFEAALVTSGSEANAMIRRAGATSEVDSVVSLEDVRVIEDAPEVQRGPDGALVSPEVVVIAALPLVTTGTDANVQVRGVTPRALAVHDNVRIAEGRFFRPGLYELVAGSEATRSYQGLKLGDTLRLGGSAFTVVGILDAGGSAFDSEVWCDADVLAPTYQRPRGIYQSLVARLSAPDQLDALRARVAADPRLRVQVDRETGYYAKASQMLSGLILGLGTLVAAVMGVGAVFSALNTMYSAVAERSREIATIRAVGFGAGAVITSFVVEALLIALVGGLVGCVAVLPVNGLTTSTMNFQTFSHLSFAFQVTPALLGLGVLFAVVMGLMGGVPPAIRAARLPITVALRDL
ncbi:MAG TPA: ABC transporter permease [Vicinamibacteria bacterium]